MIGLRRFGLGIMIGLRRFGLGIIALGAIVALASCGEPTAQVVSPGDSRFSFEIPAEFTELGGAGEEQAGQFYGLPDTSLQQIGSDPLLLMTTIAGGELASFQSLRQISTRGAFDPLDPELDPLPNDTELAGYLEISDPEVWGVRMVLGVGSNIVDFQALVDRQSDQVVITELHCNQACFIEQQDMIDQIQQSWTLGAIT
jgi:hypothetical protein